jgi:hypothetical protein
MPQHPRGPLHRDAHDHPARWLPVHLHRARAPLSRIGELDAASVATVCAEIARALALTGSFSGADYFLVLHACEHGRY